MDEDKPLLKRYEGQALTVGFVARILSIAPTTVRRWCEHGLVEAFELPRKKEGQRRHWRIRGRSIDKIIANGGKLPDGELEKE